MEKQAIYKRCYYYKDIDLEKVKEGIDYVADYARLKEHTLIKMLYDNERGTVTNNQSLIIARKWVENIIETFEIIFRVGRSEILDKKDKDRVEHLLDELDKIETNFLPMKFGQTNARRYKDNSYIIDRTDIIFKKIAQYHDNYIFCPVENEQNIREIKDNPFNISHFLYVPERDAYFVSSKHCLINIIRNKKKFSNLNDLDFFSIFNGACFCICKSFVHDICDMMVKDVNILAVQDINMFLISADLLKKIEMQSIDKEDKEEEEEEEEYEQLPIEVLPVVQEREVSVNVEANIQENHIPIDFQQSDDEQVLLQEVEKKPQQPISKKEATEAFCDKEKKEEQENLDDLVTCGICMDNRKNRIYVPCGHMFCDVCTVNMLETRTTCPNCEKEIENTVTVYF